jgi:hypothetical protein
VNATINVDVIPLSRVGTEGLKIMHKRFAGTVFFVGWVRALHGFVFHQELVHRGSSTFCKSSNMNSRITEFEIFQVTFELIARAYLAWRLGE